MRAAWDILEEKYPGLIMNGCGAHTINLLVKDICNLPIYSETLLKAREITQFVKKKNLLVCKFRKIQENMVAEGDLSKKLELEYVGATRWYTHHRCVSRVIHNKGALQRLILSNTFNQIKESAKDKSKKKKENFFNTITDLNFWTDILDCEKVLRPTSKIIGRLESNDSNLSDIYLSFLELIKEYEHYPEILKLVHERWVFLHTPSMAFAYYLDPKTAGGMGMVEDDVLITDEQIKKFILSEKKLCLDSKAIDAEIANFNRDMQYPSAKEKEFIKRTTAVTYWQRLGREKYPILFQVAEIVLAIPTSQAASERVWSMYDFIHTKRRNRLSSKKVTQLVQLYMNGDLLARDDKVLDVLRGELSDCGQGDEAETDTNEVE
jgi:hypothetical protein